MRPRALCRWARPADRERDARAFDLAAVLDPSAGSERTRGSRSGAEPDSVAVLGADGAVRSRLNAAIADSLILGALARVLLYATGLGAASKEALLLLLMVNWLYYTVAEIAQGQTPGKRRFGVRVVSADGTPAHPAQIAVRNALRIVDAVPLLYTSGLISMWRTGRSQRQRIGDVVAGTVVVPVEGRESLLASPRWLLPSVAAVALVLSVLVFITAARA